MTTKRIRILGPESSGKTTLAMALSEHLGVPWVPEFARDYLTNQGGDYNEDDLLTILGGQLELETAALRTKPPQLISDGDAISVYVWSLVKFGSCHPLIEEAARTHRYDATLLLAPDLPWVPDPLRESPSAEEREHIFRTFRKILDDWEIPYATIQGNDRLSPAIRYLAGI